MLKVLAALKEPKVLVTGLISLKLHKRPKVLKMPKVLMVLKGLKVPKVLRTL